MSPCPCTPSDLTRVSFDNGTVLLRCSTHEQQHWVVDGEPVDAADVLPRLRALFLDRRGQSTGTTTYRPRVIQLDRPTRDRAPRPAELSGTRDDQLTALLHARGLQGSWAVA